MSTMSDWWEEAPEVKLSDQLFGEPKQMPIPCAPALHCLCGRFAKFAGDRHYYNGQFDCYSYDVKCSRCGVVTVECV